MHKIYMVPGFDPWVRKILWRRKRQLNSSIVAWKIPWTKEPGGLQSMDCKELDTTEELTAQVVRKSPSAKASLCLRSASDSSCDLMPSQSPHI